MTARAGLRELRTARACPRPTVGLYEAGPAGIDAGGDRWATVCETHGAIVGHASLALARAAMPHPFEWCDACRDARRAELRAGLRLAPYALERGAPLDDF